MDEDEQPREGCRLAGDLIEGKDQRQAGEEDGVEEQYKIVTTVREDSLSGLVSNESPMGKALLGHKVGDRVEITVSKDYSYWAVLRKIDHSTVGESEELRKF